MKEQATLDQKMAHAALVSHIEQVWWVHGLAAWIAGDFQLADNFVVVGGRAEHFAADLDPDPAYVTTEESDELVRRLDALESLTRETVHRGYGGGATLPTVPTPKVRG